MDEISRVIGKIEKFQESAEARFDKIEAKLDELYIFRWKIAGAIGAILLLGEFMVHFLGGA
jgi:hypothetical protein